MKLYRVKLRGMTSEILSTAYGHPYVVADSANEAIDKVRLYLNKRNLGFARERELDTITLLAEEGDYPDCLIQLFV